jgi:hypothetical protein
MRKNFHFCLNCYMFDGFNFNVFMKKRDDDDLRVSLFLKADEILNTLYFMSRRIFFQV